MRDLIGSTRGHYSIVEKIGEGGMGEVYRAHDERLDRDVAIKVLPEEVAQDPERLTRFEREAKLLGSLSHQNIATLYGLEEHEGQRFLVMELAEGETLAVRIKKGPIPIDDALEYACQVAEGLEAAHERGIIHRDLKPANVMVDSGGGVKVLDFGLAKVVVPDASSPMSLESIAESPTITGDMTFAGVLLGTAAYMSPEQARGKTVDKRTDIFAYGALLYEMLVGTPAFEGETVTDVLAAVVKEEPDWSRLPPSTPSNVSRLLRRCLRKESRRRMHDIADARIEIEDAKEEHTGAAEPPGEAAGVRASGIRHATIAWGSALVVGAVAVLGWLRPVPAPEVSRFVQGGATQVAFSPGGESFVFVGQVNGVGQLFLRSLDQITPTPMVDTELANGPFFSPDGRWVGFFAEGKLKRVGLSGQPPVDIAEVPVFPHGATWAPDDSIIFAPTGTSTLMRVLARGGEPDAISTLDSQRGEVGHRWPEVLPGRNAVLFTAWTGSIEEAIVAAIDLDTGERRDLVEGTHARYASTGHLVYASADGTLLAVPFDPGRLEVTGVAVPILSDVRVRFNGEANFDFSNDGSLAYVSGRETTQVLIVDRKGVGRQVTEEVRDYGDPRLSPDGKGLAVSIREGAGRDIWVCELERCVFSPLTSGSENRYPTWAPDGQRIAFSSYRFGPANLFWVLVNGSGSPQPLTSGQYDQYPGSWSTDGRFILFHEITSTNTRDIYALPVEDGGEPWHYLNEPFEELSPALSPDGKWVAYVSNESGQDEVFVRAFPEPGARWQVSVDGGTEPLWGANGHEIFYWNGDEFLVARVSTTAGFQVLDRTEIFVMEFARRRFLPQYDVHPDGEQFVMINRVGEPAPLVVVLNWFEELKRLVPTE